MLVPDDAGARAIEAILTGREAHTAEADLIARGRTAESLAWLAEAGWLAPWDLPDGRAWTLTPWAAEALGYELVENWQFVTVAEERQGPRGKLVTVQVREAIATPAWRRINPDPRTARRQRPVWAHKYAREGQLRFPERVVDPAPGPEYLVMMDEETGEPVVDEAGAAVPLLLFQGLAGLADAGGPGGLRGGVGGGRPGEGLKVPRDRRMGRKVGGKGPRRAG